MQVVLKAEGCLVEQRCVETLAPRQDELIGKVESPGKIESRKRICSSSSAMMSVPLLSAQRRGPGSENSGFNPQQSPTRLLIIVASDDQLTTVDLGLEYVHVAGTQTDYPAAGQPL